MARHLLLLVFAAFICGSYVQGQVVYVTPNGAGNLSGSSWANAAPGSQLQNKITNSTGQLWVAMGTYKPNSYPAGCSNCSTNTRDYTLLLRNDLSIYGGFAGTETSLAERNPSANPTILSGDIGIPGNNSDNTYHVVTTFFNNGTAVLDGVTITDGNSNGSGYLEINFYRIYNSMGGGMVNRISSPVVRNCIFKGNGGGGLYNDESGTIISNCIFTGNSASSGGAIMSRVSNNVNITGCTFQGNSSPDGRVISSGYSNIRISNCVIWDNIGGNLVNDFQNPVNITFSCVQGNGGTGNLASNPIFVNPNDADGPDDIMGTADDGLRLQVGSPALNAGNNTEVIAGTTKDVTGAVRIQNYKVDMGAYEGGFCPISATLHVNKNVSSPGNGSSWSSAFKEMREALNVARQCTGVSNILVAGGTYTPTASSSRDSAFLILRGGLKIFGGYNALTGVRDIQANPTTLSGDIGVTNDSSDNSYHVVVIAGLGSTADSLVLDGFKITGGNAHDSGPFYYGATQTFKAFCGGIYLKNNANGNATALRNLVVNQNYARLESGGVYISNSSPLISDCTIEGNISDYIGGGMFIESGAKPLIRNCSFISNAAISVGGAIYSNGTSAEITNCTFTTNTSNNGGAIRNDAGASPGFTNCTFSANAANVGGAVSNDRCLSVFTDCVFTRNTGTSGGGAILNYTLSGITVIRCRFTQNSGGDGGAIHNNGSSPVITSSIFSKNTANNGGAIINFSSSPKILNSVFTENTSVYGGGAVFNSSSSTSLVNCSVIKNSASSLTNGVGGAICNINTSTQYISNSIVWGNTGNTPGIYGGTPTVTYSIIQGGYAGAGNLNAAPLFVDESDVDGADNILGTTDDGLRLFAGSAAINAGRNDSLSSSITTDITGAARIQSAVIDLGAYEGGLCPVYSTLYVDSSRITTGKGDSWSSAFKALSDAVAVARSCTGISSILVAKGTYKPTSDNNRDSAFAILRGGLKIYGGYPSGGGTRNVNNNPTVLSGDIGTANNNTDNTYHIAVIAGLTAAADSVVMDGFTFTKASATGGGSKAYNGWYVLSNEGGGIYLYGNNGAGGKVMVRDCKFISNAAADWGGAVYNKQSSPTLQNCVFTLNTANNAAGMFNYDGSAPKIINSVFTGNIANTDGGAIHNRLGSSPSIINCTITANSAAAAGAGIYNNGSSPVITNCIVWNNTGNYNGIYNDNSTPNVTATIVQGGHTGTGNLNTAPLFINPTDPDGVDNIFGTADDGLKLLTGSAAINSGSNAAAAGVNTDISGAARIQNVTIDRGAYEGGDCVTYTTLYVDSSVAASGKGDSWAGAFKEVREALSIARQCSNIATILVAKGTYLPIASAQRDSSFAVLRGGLKIYGGYATGGGTRNVAANPTVLSGDIGNAGDSLDNSFHVMVIGGLSAGSDSVVIDGFTITRGNATVNTNSIINGLSVNNTFGGGIFAGTGVTGKIIIRNCIITKNTATNGGGLRNNSGASPTLTNCVFSFNNALAGGAGISTENCSSSITDCSFTGNISLASGGGILNWANSPITLTNCSFTANKATSGGGIYNYGTTAQISGCVFNANNASNGGAIFNSGSSPILNNCTFSYNTGNYGGAINNTSSSPQFTGCSFTGNTSIYRGGGIHSLSSSPVIDNCTFSENTSLSGGAVNNEKCRSMIINSLFTGNISTAQGGAIYNWSDTSQSITNCRFMQNSAVDGGAISNYSSSPTITKSLFYMNTANSGGAIINHQYSTPQIIHCIFTTNSSVYGGGAIFCLRSSPSVINCIITNNSATSTTYGYGGAFCNQYPGSPLISNCIIWNNPGRFPEISNNVSTPVITYSIFKGGYAGTGNINADPLFVNAANPAGADGIWFTADDGFALQACSPAINTGINDSIPSSITSDVTGVARIFAGTVDMGPYEKQSIDYTQTTWNGVNTNWNDKANWCGGFIPTINTNVTIPGSRSFYPVITTGITAYSNNITIAAAANLKVDNGGVFNTTGNVVNSGSLTINGKIKFTGTSQQSFPGTGIIANVQQLEVACTGVGLVAFNKSFAITGELTPTSGNINMGNYNITLRSSATATASVGEIKSAASISYGTGRFIIERFINVGTVSSTVHGKSWQFLSTAVQGSGTDATAPTIRASWQEGGATASTGYGTWITDPSYTVSNGLDALSTITSIKTYSPSILNWQSLSGTAGTNIPLSNKKGYMLFVRGDRSINSASIVATTPTNMRSRGKIYDRVTLPPSTTIAAVNTFESVGNPYASAIDFEVLHGKSSNIDNVFYAWDPTLSGSYGVGGYQTISAVTGYRATPGAGKVYNIPTKDYSAIQSGQAFFVRSSAAGNATVSFSEDVKVKENFLVHRESSPQSGDPVIAMLSTMLMTGSGAMADGNRVVFNGIYSNGVDGNDAIKFSNGGENFGLLRDAKILAVEARQPLYASDTIFYNMSNVQQQEYKLVFVPENISTTGLEGILIDKYLGTGTPVSLTDTTFITISITADAGSKAADRFMLVFKAFAGPVPVTFTNVKAWRSEKNINVEWQVENELNIGSYEVEKSQDGSFFNKIGSTEARNNSGSGSESYILPDNHPATGANFYRVKSTDRDGTARYSRIVKVMIEDTKGEIRIYPNPVVNNKMQLWFTGMPEGIYYVQVFNNAGQLVNKTQLQHTTGSNPEIINSSNQMAHGNYQVVITCPDNKRIIQAVMY